jgi:putative exporter of polyketide antibiotics
MFEKLLALYLAGMMCAFGLFAPIVKNEFSESSVGKRFACGIGVSMFSWFAVGAIIGEIWVNVEKNKAEIAK